MLCIPAAQPEQAVNANYHELHMHAEPFARDLRYIRDTERRDGEKISNFNSDVNRAVCY